MSIANPPPSGGGTAAEADKDRAAGRDPRDRTVDERLMTAAINAEDVARRHGSWYWSGPRGTR